MRKLHKKTVASDASIQSFTCMACYNKCDSICSDPCISFCNGSGKILGGAADRQYTMDLYAESASNKI